MSMFHKRDVITALLYILFDWKSLSVIIIASIK